MRTVSESNRIRLREVDFTDFDNLRKIFSDPKVMHFYPSLRDEAATRQWIENSRDNYKRIGHSKWIIENKSTSEFLGYCGLILYRVCGMEEVELGYMLKRSAWGFGFALESARASLRFASEELKLSRVVSVIDSRNLAARSVSEKLGMKLERTFDDGGVERVVYSIDLSL